MSDTPIFDQLVIDRAVSDPEGVALVEGIHVRLLERQRERRLAALRSLPAPPPLPRPLDVLFPFMAGLFR